MVVIKKRDTQELSETENSMSIQLSLHKVTLNYVTKQKQTKGLA